MADRVRAVQERRRSNAAGPHGRRPTRLAQLLDALRDEPLPGQIEFELDVDEGEVLCDGCTALAREPVTLARCRAGLRRAAGEDVDEDG